MSTGAPTQPQTAAPSALPGGPVLYRMTVDEYERIGAMLDDPRVELMDEPVALEAQFRALTRLRQPATKDWADSYLAAFATVGQLKLVTFDKGLRAKANSTVMLG